MIPIDGEKLIESSKLMDYMNNLILKLKNVKATDNPLEYQKGVVTIQVINKIKEFINENERAFSSGTLVIQREEGYEKRSCSLCFFASDCCINRCGMAEEWDGECYQVQMTCEDCELQLPCKYHTTEDELNAAYIVGGEENDTNL